MPHGCPEITAGPKDPGFSRIVSRRDTLRGMLFPKDGIERLTVEDRIYIAQFYGSVFESATARKDAALVPNEPGKTNWVQKTGGLPKPIADMAGDIFTESKPPKSLSSAIAIAVSRAKELCAKGNGKYCDAVAQWEKMKARAHAT